MTTLQRTSGVLRAVTRSRFHIDRIRRVHIQAPGAVS
jgi:hypothetical protein